MKLVGVPILMILASTLMAFAWLAHLRFHAKPYLLALGVSWLLVFPEYVVNVTAIRWGIGTYTGGEMAAMHLSAGVICVALVARFFLGERLERRQIAGFVLMTIGVALVVI
jgi:uncharacterized protein (DUF486 family)